MRGGGIVIGTYHAPKNLALGIGRLSQQRLHCRQNQSVYRIAAVYCLSFLPSPPETHQVGFRTTIRRASWALRELKTTGEHTGQVHVYTPNLVLTTMFHPNKAKAKPERAQNDHFHAAYTGVYECLCACEQTHRNERFPAAYTGIYLVVYVCL